MINCGQFSILGDMTRINIDVFAEPEKHAEPSRNTWAEVSILAETPQFRAAFDESIMLWELTTFREDLKRLHTDLSGEIVWRSVETFVNLKATMDRLGHIHWEIDLIRYHPTATLYLEFESDQSYLPALIEQLDSIFMELRSAEAA